VEASRVMTAERIAIRPKRRFIIIGAGFSGIGMAIRLRQSGIDDFVILERAGASGGTWRDNSYPGCACDVQSTLYSFSFAPNPEWSQSYATQPEIWAYLQRCIAEHDIGRHIELDEEVTGASWSDAAQQWTVTTARHRWTSQVLVMASGPLSEPATPDIAGLESFNGPVFHSARWNHTLDLTRQRVAVIGTGASAIQFVPKLQPRVAHLDLYQRTPPWILPRWDRAIPEWRKSLYRRFPAAQRLQRGALFAVRELLHFPFRHPAAAVLVESAARRHLRSQLADPDLRARLTPNYRIGCKRILVSDDYYPALAERNVALVTDAIATVTADGIRTVSGESRPADVLILGTGFRPTDPPLAPYIVGKNNLSLAESWRGSPAAYMSTTVAGFPNFFMLLGPNTGVGHTSVVLLAEAQIEHVLELSLALAQRGATAVEPSMAAQTQYISWIDRRLATTVWNRGGCSSWYLDRTGRNSTIWPDGIRAFRRRVSVPRMADYVFTPRAAV
jgi:cation diffusion facilitator CzcD-associated flavoprotein CzcO